MIPIFKELINSSHNFSIKANTLKFEKKIDINHNIYYLSVCDNNIYCKMINNNMKPDNETTIRFNVSDPYNPVIDDTFSTSYGIASHNMYFFKDKYNNIKTLGGQHYGICSYKQFINNMNYNEYHKNIKFIDSTEYTITMGGYDKIYDPTQISPYYANGLHLFEFNNNKLEVMNNGLPIITGINPGRYDGHYGHTNNRYLNSCRNGLTVYDSEGSIVYNKKQNLYYLYHRANIGTGFRSIQYATSYDLINWSEYNIVNFGDSFNYFGCNMYYSNFFNMPNTDIYLAILPYIKKNSFDYSSTDNIEYYQLYYSYDCSNFHYIGNIMEYNIKTLESYSLSTNYPILFNNIMFFYIGEENNEPKINIYTIEKDRFCYITNYDNTESIIELNELIFDSNIMLNLDVEENGYVLIEILEDANYSFNNFDIIKNINSLEYIASWKGNTILPRKNLSLKIKLYNAKIYTINGKIN